MNQEKIQAVEQTILESNLDIRRNHLNSLLSISERMSNFLNRIGMYVSETPSKDSMVIQEGYLNLYKDNVDRTYDVICDILNKLEVIEKL